MQHFSVIEPQQYGQMAYDDGLSIDAMFKCLAMK